MPDLPSGTVTFLFTDIEGSTRLWERHPDAMREALARHDALLRDAIESHGGAVFKTVGDAFCAAFDTAPDAVAAALAAQRALCAEPWGEPVSLRVRMALHTGAAEERHGDYFGQPLNRVARLLEAGHAGQILLCAATQELLRDDLPQGAGLRDLGEHHLKDLARPEHLFQLLHPELPDAFPPLQTLDSRPNNLPAQPTPLIGRAAEIDAVRRLLRRDEIRLVTLTGAGGSGKTRLGLQIAAELLDDFADGAFFVPLAPITDPGLVAATLAQTLAVREAEGRPLLECLKEFLRPKQMLLVLDNFEQVLPATPLVSELLTAAPRLKVLVTSRAVLRLRGEHDFPVPPLASPDPKRPLSVEALSQYAAVELFIQRAVAARPEFSVTNENAPAVAEICCRLDGLPLAVELAAARVRLLSPQAMLGRLERRLPLLVSGARDVPARQQTLRNTIVWSYDLLSEEERRLFRRLAVFAGGCSLDAAEVICRGGGEFAGLPPLEIEIFEGLASLVDQSLVKQEELDGGEPRFSLLETIREFGLECLATSGEEEAIHRQHALWFVEWAREGQGTREDGLWSPLPWQTVERDLDNFRAALTWAVEQGEAMLGLRGASALGWFWGGRGFLAEGRQRFTDLLALPAAQPHTEMRARALTHLGGMANGQGDYEAAERLFEESLAIWREIGGDPRWNAVPMEGLGRALSARGDYARSRAYLEEALDLFREMGATCEVADTLYLLGGVARLQGDYDRAEEIYQESLRGYRKLVIREQHAARELRNLGHVALFRGEREQAKALFRESLEILKDGGLKPFLPGCLAGMAGVAAAEGQPERAARLLGAAQALVDALGAAWEPEERAEYERHQAAVRAQLDDATFAGAWSEGNVMSLEQAITDALELPDGT